MSMTDKRSEKCARNNAGSIPKSCITTDATVWCKVVYQTSKKQRLCHPTCQSNKILLLIIPFSQIIWICDELYLCWDSKGGSNCGHDYYKNISGMGSWERIITKNITAEHCRKY